jgi:hypothetical protein
MVWSLYLFSSSKGHWPGLGGLFTSPDCDVTSGWPNGTLFTYGENRLRMLEHNALREMLDLKRTKYQVSIRVCTPHLTDLLVGN